MRGPVGLLFILLLMQPHSVRAQILPPDQSVHSGRLTIRVVGFAHHQGQLIVNVFLKEDGFPADRQRALRSIAGPITNQNTQDVEISDLPAGQYAVSVLHDENANGQLDTNFLGIPKEPTGTSRNVKGHFGPPKFRDAVFALGREDMILTITLH